MTLAQQYRDAFYSSYDMVHRKIWLMEKFIVSKASCCSSTWFHSSTIFLDGSVFGRSETSKDGYETSFAGRCDNRSS